MLTQIPAFPTVFHYLGTKNDSLEISEVAILDYQRPLVPAGSLRTIDK